MEKRLHKNIRRQRQKKNSMRKTKTTSQSPAVRQPNIVAYFDGACEPVNPGGYASFGAVIFIDGVKVWELSKLFVPQKGRESETSNNVAEYSGFIAILEYLLENKLNNEEIQIYGDSMLVLCQMLMDDPKWHKRWEIKDGFYVPLALKAKKLLEQFPKIKGEWIPREKNSIADELSKAELIKAGITFRIQPNG
jgi:ribonuclease HI